MLGKKRTAYDFLAEIVQESCNPISKTNLYYKIKTQFNVLERWLNTASYFGLIENLGDKYQTTPKGLEWLQAWKQQQTFLKRREQK